MVLVATVKNTNYRVNEICTKQKRFTMSTCFSKPLTHCDKKIDPSNNMEEFLVCSKKTVNNSKHLINDKNVDDKFLQKGRTFLNITQCSAMTTRFA